MRHNQRISSSPPHRRRCSLILHITHMMRLLLVWTALASADAFVPVSCPAASASLLDATPKKNDAVDGEWMKQVGLVSLASIMFGLGSPLTAKAAAPAPVVPSSTIQVAEAIKVLDDSLPSYGAIKDSRASVETVKSLSKDQGYTKVKKDYEVGQFTTSSGVSFDLGLPNPTGAKVNTERKLTPAEKQAQLAQEAAQKLAAQDAAAGRQRIALPLPAQGTSLGILLEDKKPSSATSALGGTVVTSINDDSPFAETLKVNDELVGWNDLDISKRTLKDLKLLLSKKRGEGEVTLTVMRRSGAKSAVVDLGKASGVPGYDF
mmetsp:Transcript_7766/g.17178  ORF Transcript_7766/g.17178 Transcript_7766/m.17178 type:complete len:319 (-) Transcript_7766:327-1283(-)